MNIQRTKLIVSALAFSMLLMPSMSMAVVSMNNYCVTPAFIQESILPNLLLLIDNSASMYDLAYTDVGKKSCSGSGADCTATGDAGCPSGETCSTFARQPVYCYDQSYSTAKTYVGYFDSSKRYSYDSATAQFVEDAAAFSCTAGAGETAKSVSGQLCVIYNSSNALTAFKGSGNYLNWLTASKFDVQKQILTGGKYMSKVCSNNATQTCAVDADCGAGTCGTVANPYLLAESRGCVGRSFTKEALTGNFVNYASPETNNTNTSLGITFSIRGPFDTVNPSAASQGGQTWIDIYKGNLTQTQKINCQTAMNTIISTTSSNAAVKQDVCNCLTGDAQCNTSGTVTAVTKTKVAFQQSVQACWACQASTTSPTTCAKTDINIDDMNTAELQCTDIYMSFATCSNDPTTICTTATPGTSGAAVTTTGETAVGSCGTCTYGPSAIVPGNPALFCGNDYMGQYYAYQGPGSAGSCSVTGSACTSNADCSPSSVYKCSKTNVVCTSDTECPKTGVGGVAGNQCETNKPIANTCGTSATAAGWFNINGTKTYPTTMYQSHRDFCGAFKATPVIDPTDSPSNTTAYDNVPAILSGTAIEANLNQPIASVPVKIRKATSPTGVVGDFSNQIRIGAMTFNYTGSASEAVAGGLSTPKICSNDVTKTCNNNIDCVSPGTCQATTAGVNNLDGGSIVYYIGTGKCSATTSTVCYNNAGCPSGERCIPDGVGDHTKGLVKSLDDIKARAWTPFAEAYYDAMGYFAKTSSGTSRTDLRLNTTDFNENRNPSQYKCQSNNILLISDGMSTADRNTTVDNFAKLYTAAGGATSWTNTCPVYSGSVNLDNLAWVAKHRNINTLSTSSASTTVPAEKNESITTYVVYNGDSNGQAGECDSRTLMAQTAANGGTTLYQAVDPSALDTELRDAFKAVASGLASGTASSILNNSEGSGAALIQAVFYPKKVFDSSTEATWIGEMQGLWYFLDPNLNKSSIREDSSADRVLNLKNDRVVQFYFDQTQKKTLVNRYQDANGDGAADNLSSPVDTVSFEDVNSIWKAGRLLWERDLATSPRTIYTSFGSTSGSTPRKFSKLDADGYLPTWPNFQDALQIPASADSALRTSIATKIIDYVHGTDQSGWRNRKVTITGCGLANCTREWRLGDIITSTPKVVSSVKANSYDADAPTGYGDKTYETFVKSSGYQSRGMVFVGGNDGMIHAFKLGILKEINTSFDRAKIINPDGTTATAASGLGKEMWAFIPKHLLPYLIYMADPNYTHLYYVDRTPTIVDASINKPTGCTATSYADCTKDSSSWRTILIGGTGIGGATRSPTDICTNCVRTPLDGTGYSSYFALDVTDPENPLYLWDFYGDVNAPGELGYATTGATVVRISTKVKDTNGNDTTKPDHTKNGKWFAVFASGPSGSVDTVKHQFLGESGRHLRLFIVDLATGTLLRKITTTVNDAFGGSLATSTIDTDRYNAYSEGYYSDDAVYIPYVKLDTATNTWTKGGVLRLLTKESANPNDWVVSTVVDDIGPVTSAVGKLQDRANSKLWLYVGTGRYYYKLDDNTTTQQKLYGIKEPCYSTANRTMQTPIAGGTYNDIDPTCTDAVSGSFTDQSGSASSAPATTIAATAPGWSITLDAASTDYMTEREITDPVASTNGAVFFTTIKPSADICKFGGDSMVWAVRYDTGGVPPSASMQGRALMQVSTGAFAEFSLADAFKNPGNLRLDGRRTTDSFTGLSATGGGLLLVTNPRPIKKMLHIQEK